MTWLPRPFVALGPRREADAQPLAPPSAQGAIPVHAVGDESPAAVVLRAALDPALSLLAPWGVPGSLAARQLLLTISGQEAAWTARRQSGKGPARGLWQFERAGGVNGVLTHPVSATLARLLCQARGVLPVAPDVWAALERDDVLAAGMARLLLRTDPAPLPTDADGGWRYYLRCWRPGEPRPESWPARWKVAAGLLGVASAKPIA